MDKIDYIIIKTTDQNEFIGKMIRRALSATCVVPFGTGYFAVMDRPSAAAADIFSKYLGYCNFVSEYEIVLVDKDAIGRTLAHFPASLKSANMPIFTNTAPTYAEMCSVLLQKLRRRVN